MNFEKRIDMFPTWVEKAQEIGTLLKEQFHIEVRPYPVKTNMMHFHLPTTPDKLNTILKNYTDTNIKFGVWAEEPKGYSRCELTIGDGAIELSQAEIKKIFKNVLGLL